MDKKEYYDLSEDNLKGVKKEYEEYKNWSKVKKEENSISKYLRLIQISYDDAVIINKIGKDKDDDEYGPCLYFMETNHEIKIYSNHNPTHSYHDLYKDNERFASYSLGSIIEYIEESNNIKIRYQLIDSPISKDKFLLRITENNDEDTYFYIRDEENNNEFEYNKEGYKKAALGIYLFYIKKYICSK